jgi:micrococcal nuclease
MSRRRRNGIIALCLLLAALFIWLDHSPIRGKWQRQPGDFEKYHAKTFIVVKIIDGDTFDINVPDGDYDYTRIRLLGVDTPETKHPKLGVMHFGPEASEFTRKLTFEKPVQVYLDKNHIRGYFGRLLAYVQLPDGRVLNEVLLNEGFAYAYADLRFRHNFYHKYTQLEASARKDRKGLWAKVR